MALTRIAVILLTALSVVFYVAVSTTAYVSAIEVLDTFGFSDSVGKPCVTSAFVGIGSCIAIEYLPRNKMAQMISAIHEGDGYGVYLIHMLSVLAEHHFADGPKIWASLSLTAFVTAKILFFFLFADRETGNAVMKKLNRTFGALSFLHATKGAWHCFIICLITTILTWLIKEYKLGGLRAEAGSELNGIFSKVTGFSIPKVLGSVLDCWAWLKFEFESLRAYCQL